MKGHRNISNQDDLNEFTLDQKKSSIPTKSARGLARGMRAMAVLLASLLVTISLCAQNAASTAPSGSINVPEVLKLPVAHAHFGSWCTGYLTITPEGVRYDVVRAHGKDEHSFFLKREQVLFLNYWVLSGQSMNAVELRTDNKIYHFWLMQSADQLMSAAWRPFGAASSDTLMVSLYYWRVTGNVPDLAAVNAALVEARAQAASNAAMAQANASGNSAANEASQKMHDHMYVNNYSSTVTTKTMNSINHMSHW